MRFTVLTPTYNRAHTLPAVYASLCAQTCSDFEWLLVDDGSTDGTRALVEGWIAEARIVVRYVAQPNRGKHVAFNRGVREARGELLITLDSDDRVLPEALERLSAHWTMIPDRDRFSGITGLCVDPGGAILGGPFPQDMCDASPLDVPEHAAGERWGFHRTELLRACPYPEIPGERFIAEGLVWHRLADHYLIRYVNEPLRVVEYREDGLSAQAVALRAGSPRGAMLYYRELAALARSRAVQAKALINLARFALHARVSVLATLRDAHAGLLLPLYATAGALLWRRDQWALPGGSHRQLEAVRIHDVPSQTPLTHDGPAGSAFPNAVNVDAPLAATVRNTWKKSPTNAPAGGGVTVCGTESGVANLW
jgi:glycosyltransferase involved in cell wall biosynthesis